jgi:hypothetical protein
LRRSESPNLATTPVDPFRSRTPESYPSPAAAVWSWTRSFRDEMTSSMIP